MNRQVRSGIALALMLCGRQAAAEPCVGPAFDRPFPGATEVVSRYADVPSANFPGLWQEGRINGLAYALYANGEALLQDSATNPAWSISVTCQDGAERCAQVTTGQPPAAAGGVAAALAECLTGPVLTGPDAPAAPQPPAAPPPPAPVAAQPCGLAKLPPDAPVITLQRLLVEAGADPGPINGRPGKQTGKALLQVLGRAARTLTVEQAIAALDAQLCAKTD